MSNVNNENATFTAVAGEKKNLLLECHLIILSKSIVRIISAFEIIATEWITDSLQITNSSFSA